jgi:hypothetical protein
MEMVTCDSLFGGVVVLREEDVVDGRVGLGRVLGAELNDGTTDVLKVQDFKLAFYKERYLGYQVKPLAKFNK